MKRLLLPVFIAFLGASGNHAMAQPTLTAATNNLQIGDKYQIGAVMITNLEFTNAAPAGANQTWNFSTLTGATTIQAEVLNRSAAPKPTSYPSANMVVQAGAENAYYENTGTVLKEWAAFESAQNYTLENTNPADKMRFPFTYTNTFTDTYAGSANIGGTVVPRIGSITVTAEGYGTLILPSGTHQNVLKIKSEETSNQGTMFAENTTTYDWFEPGIHFPLLRIMKRVTPLGTMFTCFYFINPLTGTSEELAKQAKLQLFPNPANSTAKIQLELNSAAKASLKVTNLLGAEITTIDLDKHKTGLQTHVLDVSGYAKGIYLVQLEMDGKVALKRLVVQ